MRIGLVRRGYSNAGGAESYLRGFAQAAVAEGHEVLLLASQIWPDWTAGEQRVIPGESPVAFSKNLSLSAPKCDVLFSLERVSACDVFRVGDGVHAAWLERRARFSTAWQRFSFPINPKHRALLRLEKEALTSAKRVIVNSRMVQEEIARFYGSEIAEKTALVYNGIDVEKWRAAPASLEELRRELGLSLEEKVAVFVGSGWARKGLPWAEAATREAGFTLLVCGNGRLPARSAGHVRFLGVERPVATVLHAADAFILPTIYDPFSNATLEALAVGLPIITSTANGVAEILDPAIDGTAVADPSDIPALAAALTDWKKRDSPQLRHLRQQKAAYHTLKRNFSATLHIIAS